MSFRFVSPFVSLSPFLSLFFFSRTSFARRSPPSWPALFRFPQRHATPSASASSKRLSDRLGASGSRKRRGAPKGGRCLYPNASAAAAASARALGARPPRCVRRRDGAACARSALGCMYMSSARAAAALARLSRAQCQVRSVSCVFASPVDRALPRAGCCAIVKSCASRSAAVPALGGQPLVALGLLGEPRAQRRLDGARLASQQAE